MDRIQTQAPVLYRHLQLEAVEYSNPVPETEWLTDEVTDIEGADGIFIALLCRLLPAVSRLALAVAPPRRH